jgi:hypothetical protein
MKKNIILWVLLSFYFLAGAQDPSYRDKLFYACKVYGLVKYYHSEVSVCKVNWDSVMLARLPLIKAAVTSNDFNEQLLALVQAAGPMARAKSPLNDNRGPELKFNLDFKWTGNNSLRADVQDMLDTIILHFRPHPSCWVVDNDYQGDYTGWLVFPHDSAMFRNNMVDVFPDEHRRMLYIFKYWNIVRHFNPYNDITDYSWDSTFRKNIMYIANSANVQQYYFAIKRFAAGINDAHAEGLTSARYISPPTYYYSPEIILNYIEDKYTVVASNYPSVKKGFVLTGLNGRTVKQMEDSLSPYISAGNPAVFHRTMCSYILNGYANSSVSMSFMDSANLPVTFTTQRKTYMYENFFFSYYPNDSLSAVSYRKINCDIGYVNMGNLINSEVTAMYNSLRNSRAIVFDLRNYPNGTIISIASLLFPNNTACANFKIPDVNYPGTFIWDYSSFGSNNNSGSYKGKVIILVNQETQSQAEYTAMILRAMPGAIIVGSQTAGADGNITYFNISRDLNVGFTTLGVFYPNGDSTQRVGIIPDYQSGPTRAGLMANKDEVLYYALNLAGCWDAGTSSPAMGNSLRIYPNPSGGAVNIATAYEGSQDLEITDINGKVVFRTVISGNTELDLAWLHNGVYSLIISTAARTETCKLVILR